MKAQRIELIPISEIRVVNARECNKITFANIVSNITKVGLKKPITVGNLRQTGHGTTSCTVKGVSKRLINLPTQQSQQFVIDAPVEDRYLMSLVENIARRRPSNSELVREVQSLMDRGHRTAR